MHDSPGHILLADDDEFFRKTTSRLLESQGHVVDQVGDLPSALAHLETTVFDVVVADVNMPGNEGLAVLRSCKVPVLIVTGEPTLDGAVLALRGSAVDYLAKPFVPARLLERVTAGIARGRALRMLAGAQTNLNDQLELANILRMSLQVSGPRLVRNEPDPDIDERLSHREREVLMAFRATPRISTVAKQLCISPHTVRNHLKSIFRKLEVNSQTELLAKIVPLEH